MSNVPSLFAISPDFGYNVCAHVTFSRRERSSVICTSLNLLIKMNMIALRLKKNLIVVSKLLFI